jgi:hypothetical protein
VGPDGLNLESTNHRVCDKAARPNNNPLTATFNSVIMLQMAGKQNSKAITTCANSLLIAMPLQPAEAGSAVMVASKCGAKYMLNMPAKTETRILGK